ncbi:MAG: OsmC family protein [Burkholderiales bacterium]|nr:OsmC family protein [Burkholderiales bacterium]MDE2159874.1 OsmC family protein [Burkholderiales bacterium]MDE2505162.1 OsmC family protein [Burkholderiales bacterium]
MSAMTSTVQLTQVQDYRFELDFGGATPRLQADEPPPLGAGLGPSPVQLLASAVGNCLGASLLFALRKFKQQPEPLTCTVTADVGRNADGRLRVLALRARLALGVPAARIEHLDRVLGGFEAYCTVTESVRAAIPVEVEVFDALGAKLN